MEVADETSSESKATTPTTTGQTIKRGGTWKRLEVVRSIRLELRDKEAESEAVPDEDPSTMRLPEQIAATKRKAQEKREAAARMQAEAVAALAESEALTARVEEMAAEEDGLIVVLQAAARRCLAAPSVGGRVAWAAKGRGGMGLRPPPSPSS